MNFTISFRLSQSISWFLFFFVITQFSILFSFAFSENDRVIVRPERVYSSFIGGFFFFLLFSDKSSCNTMKIELKSTIGRSILWSIVYCHINNLILTSGSSGKIIITLWNLSFDSFRSLWLLTLSGEVACIHHELIWKSNWAQIRIFIRERLLHWC